FQAEDGIRDSRTGVQTCALPISPRPASPKSAHETTTPLLDDSYPSTQYSKAPTHSNSTGTPTLATTPLLTPTQRASNMTTRQVKIGRASCRERVEQWRHVSG